MLRCLIFVSTLTASLAAAALPEQFAQYQRGPVTAVSPDDRPIWDECGYVAGEKAEYKSDGQTVTITAFRFKDPTGAFAAFQWQRPENAQSGLTSASTQNGSMAVHDNYLLQFDGGKLLPDALAQLYGKLPDRQSSSLPPLAGYLPSRGRVANSERYLLGPAALAKFEPRITADLASFGQGAEGQSARYRNNLQLTIFSYPTPQMAIERFRHFETLPGAAVRRSGPLIAVVPDGKQIAAAQSLIEQVHYNPKLTWNEEVPKATPQDAAKMILAISLLAAGLIGASVILGLFFGGGKVLARKFGIQVAEENFTTLHIGDR